jgi:hypothetical protein
MRLGQRLIAISLLGGLSFSCAGEDPSSGVPVGLPPAGSPGGTTAGVAPTGGGAAPGGVQGGTTAGGALPGGGAVPPSSITNPAVVQGPGNKVCATQVINAYGTVPDMLIVLDRSQSMMLYNRWQPSKQAVKAITSEFEGLLAFGLEYFPGATASDVDILSAVLGGQAAMCAGGERLDVPMTLRNAGAIAQSLDRTMTKGLTPTGAALRAALQVLGDRTQQLDTTVKPGYVLLVTDGDPMCDQQLSLQPGAVDMAQQDEARAAVKALKDKGIPTYVIGYQIDAMRQAIMNEMAMLGGTTKYHAAESSDQIIAAFRQITKDVIKCTFDLQPVDNKPIDPKYVRVQIDKTSVPLNSADGWVINGNTITLQGGACATLKDGKGHNLNAQVECTEVILE